MPLATRALAVPRFDAVAAARLARRAGDQASQATDHGEAAQHYRRALAALDFVPASNDDLRLELSIRLGESLLLIGDEEGATLLRRAAELVRGRGDAVALAQAVCAMVPVPGGSTSVGQVDTSFISYAEAALEMLPMSEAGWRARVQAVLAVQLAIGAQSHHALEVIEAAVRAARELGDPVLLGRTLLSYRFFGGPLEIEQRVACGRELIDLGEQTGLEQFACVGRQQLWWCSREMGDRDEMDRWFEAAERHVRGPDVEQMSQAAIVALLDGDIDGAERLTDSFATFAIPLGMEEAYITCLRGAIDDCRGHPGDREGLQGYVDSGHGYTAFVEANLARCCARMGDTRRARNMVDRIRDVGFPSDYGPYLWTAMTCWWAETAAILGDASAVGELCRLLDPLSGRLVDVGSAVFDTVDRVRALGQTMALDAELGATIAASAVAASRRRRMPIFLGRELVVLAAAQQRIGISPAAIAPLIEEAFAIARRTGARIIAQDASLYLPDQAALCPPDPLGLTPRERDILGLLALGATNAQIGSDLGISPATVRKHLENAYGKLGVSTRTAAAARVIAEPHGLRG